MNMNKFVGLIEYFHHFARLSSKFVYSKNGWYV